jgi:hypothetical protein
MNELELNTKALAEANALLAEYTGKNLKPQDGCSFITVDLGGYGLLLEYEYEPAEAPIYNLDSPMCGPGCSESASLLCALVNGRWVDADVFSESLRERWTQQIIDSEAEQAISQREGYERDRYDDDADFADAQQERAALRGGAYAAALGEAT